MQRTDAAPGATATATIIDNDVVVHAAVAAHVVADDVAAFVGAFILTTA